MRALTRSLLPLLFTTAMHAQQPTTLAALHDQARPLLIFGGAGDTRVQQQYADLAVHAGDAQQRDMRVALITGAPGQPLATPHPPQVVFAPDEQERLRQRFHVQPREFTVILIGKDGGEKLRSHMPIPWDTLAATIDAMPMRRDEMKRR